MSVTYTTERTEITDSLLLDANEHYQQWVNLDTVRLTELNRYPDTHAAELRRALATYYCSRFTADNMLITSGSIEAIDVLVRALRPDTLIVNTPGYDVYTQQAAIYNVPVTQVSFLPTGDLDTKAILQAGKGDSLAILIHPNNPTGRCIARKDALDIIEQFKGTVVIDEAYIEYAGLEHSFEDLVLEHTNVVILRTFSKAWGLAGLRLGYIIASPTMIARLAVYKNAYSVNSIALQAGICALHQAHELPRQISLTLERKQRLFERLERAGIPVTNTDANFLIIAVPHAGHLKQKLSQQGVLVRPRKLIDGTGDCLRVTISTNEQNDQFFRSLMKAWHD